MFPIESGIEPQKELDSRCKVFNILSAPKEYDNLPPSNLLEPKNINSSLLLEHCDNPSTNSVISPLIPLPVRANVCKLQSLPNENGILPVMLFSDKSKLLKLVRCPRPTGN